MTLDILMPGMSGFDVLRGGARRPGAAPDRRSSSCRSTRGREALAGEWAVPKPIDAEELTDALGSAVLAGRARVLVVGRERSAQRLEPALERLGLEHDWATSGAERRAACARSTASRSRSSTPACAARRRSLERARPARAAAAALGGRLLDRRGGAPGIVATLDADPVPLEEAATAVLQVAEPAAEG